MSGKLRSTLIGQDSPYCSSVATTGPFERSQAAQELNGSRFGLPSPGAGKAEHGAGGGTGRAGWDEAGRKGAGERRDREYAQEERRVVCAPRRFRLTVYTMGTAALTLLKS